MESSWKTQKLDDLILKRNQGVNTTTEKVKYSEAGVPVIRANNISQGRIDFDECVFVDDLTFQRIKEPCKPKKGDVLYTNIGSQFGSAAKIDTDFEFTIAWNVLRIQVGKHLDADFLVYILNNPKNKAFIQSLNSSSTMPFVSGKVVGSLDFSFPDYDTQKSIVSKLKPLDDKIQLNRQTNQTLEKMAQALFKSWFIDFDPVIDNALAASTNVSDFPEVLQHREEQRKHAQQLPDFKVLPDDIRNLFPSEFEQTDEPHFGISGWVPKGWKVSELGEFIKFANGKAKKSTSDGSYPIYGANGIIGKTDEVKFKNAVIIGRVGAYCGAIEYCRGDFWSSDNTIVATSKLSEEQIPHILYLLKHLNLNQYAGGAAQPLLNQTTLNKLKIPFAGIDCLNQFNKTIDSLLQKQIKNTEQTEKLCEIRDVLLPKLISGELQLQE